MTRKDAVNKEEIRNRVSPYTQECVFAIAVDLLVMGVVFGLFIYAGFPAIAHIIVYTTYFTIALLLHYRVCIQSIVDRIKGDCVTETVYLQSFEVEYSFTGDRLGHSYVRLFYPKEMDVDRYRIVVIDQSETKKKIRSAMSNYRKGKIAELDRYQIKHFRMTYLKRSKILIHIDADIEEKDVDKKHKEAIEKAIRCINRSV